MLLSTPPNLNQEPHFRIFYTGDVEKFHFASIWKTETLERLLKPDVFVWCFFFTSNKKKTHTWTCCTYIPFILAHDWLTYVLASEAHQPAGHVQRVLTSLQHPAQPVEGSVFIWAPHWLVQGWDAVVVFFTCKSDPYWQSAFSSRPFLRLLCCFLRFSSQVSVVVLSLNVHQFLFPLSINFLKLTSLFIHLSSFFLFSPASWLPVLLKTRHSISLLELIYNIYIL